MGEELKEDIATTIKKWLVAFDNENRAQHHQTMGLLNQLSTAVTELRRRLTETHRELQAIMQLVALLPLPHPEPVLQPQPFPPPPDKGEGEGRDPLPY